MSSIKWDTNAFPLKLQNHCLIPYFERAILKRFNLIDNFI